MAAMLRLVTSADELALDETVELEERTANVVVLTDEEFRSIVQSVQTQSLEERSAA